MAVPPEPAGGGRAQAGDQTGNPVGCARSDRICPSLVAAGLGVKGGDFKDVSCSGATLTDLTARQSTGDGTNPTHLTALSRDTRLVTVGTGGNDIGFTSMIRQDAPCARKYADGIQEIFDRAFKTGDYQYAAESLVLAVVTGILTFVFYRVTNRKVS